MGHSAFEIINGLKYTVAFINARKCSTYKSMLLELMSALNVSDFHRSNLDAMNDGIYGAIYHGDSNTKVVVDNFNTVDEFSQQEIRQQLNSYKNDIENNKEDQNSSKNNFLIAY